MTYNEMFPQDGGTVPGVHRTLPVVLGDAQDCSGSWVGHTAGGRCVFLSGHIGQDEDGYDIYSELRVNRR